MKYYLYIDECGDQNLSNFEPTFPIFTLCGILVREDKDQMLREQIEKMKMEIFGTKDIILHSRDIRKCQKGFEVLFDLELKKHFYLQINEILGQEGVYVIISSCILKEPYIRHYGKYNDVYAQSLSFLLERVIFCLEDEPEPPTVHTIVEMRGKKEDKNLLAYYTQMLDTGTYWVTSDRFKSHLRQFDFIPKKANFIGLQVADLVAYPVTRHILNPSELNPAYDAIKHNIYSKDGKQLGLIVFPKER